VRDNRVALLKTRQETSLNLIKNKTREKSDLKDKRESEREAKCKREKQGQEGEWRKPKTRISRTSKRLPVGPS
jgi:hypothetical protein